MGKILTPLPDSSLVAKPLADATGSLLRRGIKGVFVAGSAAPPPVGALMPCWPRLVLVVRGSRGMLFDRQGHIVHQKLSSGQVLYVSARAWVKPVETSNNTILVVEQRPDSFHAYWRSFSAPPQESRRHSDRFVVRPEWPAANLLSALEGLSTLPGYDSAVQALATSLLQIAVQSALRPLPVSSPTERLVGRVMEYVLDHLGEPLDRASVARVFRIHPNHLSRIFRKVTGTGFNEHVTKHRLQTASRLLAQYDFSVKEVAARCGFSDANYFSKVYRREYATSPGSMRMASAAEAG